MTELRPPFHVGPVVARNDDLEVSDCRACGFAHLYPLPDPAVIERFYGGADRFYADPSWFEKEQREHETNLWDAVYRWQTSLLRDGNEIDAVIDWGAGAGWFAEWWDRQVGEAVGIEPSQKAREQAYGRGFFDVYPPGLGRAVPGLVKGHVRLSLVLEHVADPLWVLRKATYGLAFGGRLLVVVPNEFNPLQNALRPRHGDWFVDRTHCNYFTPAGLRALFEAAGLRIVFEGATFPMETFALLGLDYLRWPNIGEELHKIRLRLEWGFGDRMFKLYRWLYNRWGIGRELVFVGEKK